MDKLLSRQHNFFVCNLLLMFSIIFVVLMNLQYVLAIETTESSKIADMNKIDLLRAQLLTNYDKNSHPLHNGIPTNISLGMSVNYIDIDELNGKITLHSWLRIRWMDDKRSWNNRDYDNITHIHLRAREVWKPDITLLNSAGNEGNYIGDTQVILYYDGSFLWVPPAVYKAYCNLNLLMWPYDTQECKLRIGTWSMTNIDSQPTSTENVDYVDLVQSTEWEIVQGKMNYKKMAYYNYMEFSFKIRRRSSMYTAVIYTPATCIILLALSSFWLPPQMGEKIFLNGIIIVVIAAFLMYFAQLMPILAENIPLIVLFYSSSLLLLSISTIISVVVLYLSTTKHKRRIPEQLRKLLNGNIGRILMLSHFTLESESILNNGTKEMGDNIFNDHTENDIAVDPTSINPPSSLQINRSIQFDWVLLATAIDRIAFFGYSLIFFALAIAFHV